MLSLENEESPIRHEHISFVLTSNFLLSFQERPGDVFEPVRNRLQSGKGRLRHRKTDYLLYTLIDVVVDNYFSIVNKLTDKVAALEEQLLEDDSPHIVQEIVTQSKQLLYLRRAILPLREAIRTLLKEEDDLIEEPTIAFFNNVLDNLQQVASDLEMSREMLSGLMNLHQSNLSNRMNEVMKTLTIIATIFIPLTFVAGIYGMNFQYMPELGWEYSYPIAIGFMALPGIVMFIYMKRKNWF